MHGGLSVFNALFLCNKRCVICDSGMQHKPYHFLRTDTAYSIKRTLHRCTFQLKYAVYSLPNPVAIQKFQPQVIDNMFVFICTYDLSKNQLGICNGKGTLCMANSEGHVYDKLLSS